MTIGILLTALPTTITFRNAVRLAESALRKGLTVYLYCSDDAVTGVEDTHLQRLVGENQNLRLFACAYAANKRNYPLNDHATFCGLTVLSDIISTCDRFIAFN